MAAENWTRRRFLTDLLFAGGIITVAAGLAWTYAGSAEAAGKKSPSPSPSAEPHHPHPGEMCPVPPKASPTPKSSSTPRA